MPVVQRNDTDDDTATATPRAPHLRAQQGRGLLEKLRPGHEEPLDLLGFGIGGHIAVLLAGTRVERCRGSRLYLAVRRVEAAIPHALALSLLPTLPLLIAVLLNRSSPESCVIG